MKTLYFDCSSGISGNMTLGALLELVKKSKKYIKAQLILKKDTIKNATKN